VVVLFYALEIEVLRDTEAPDRDKFFVEAAKAYLKRAECRDARGDVKAADADRKRAARLEADARTAATAKAPAEEKPPAKAPAEEKPLAKAPTSPAANAQSQQPSSSRRWFRFGRN
jgi:hypothetical protein